MLTLHKSEDGATTGRFCGDLAFMRVRSQRRAMCRWRPEDSDIERA